MQWVSLFVCVLSFIKLNYAQQRPCTTAQGTAGNCMKEELCVIPGGSTISTERLCGIDLDGSKLYCCEQKTTQVFTNFRGDVEDDSVSTSTTTTTARTTPVYVTTPQLTTSSTVNAQVNNIPVSEQSCLTPNGEEAVCIPISRCHIFTKIIAEKTVSTEQINYIRESKCGYNETYLVCCGTKVDYDKTPDDIANANFVRNSLIPESCGLQVITRIFGGIDSESTDFPWLALLEYNQYGSKKFLCDGSLISSRYVLTAAHCLITRDADLINVRLGEWDVGSSDKNCQGGDNLKVCNPWKRNYGIHSVYPHPKYSVATKQNDIGLIRLNEEVQFNDMISPICLPLANSYIFPGDKLTVAGWGLKSYTQVATTKQKVDLPVVATSECSLVFRNILKIKKGQFCAGGEARKDSCNGDSGAPLMRLSPEPIPRWSIEGIVSFGLGCGLVGRYGVYTKVSEYVGWIHNTVTS
ncbi:phenoloxidase-activating factor 1-like [Rhynchophorus ferrugineus]|uniref:phenoloxidase-activating factor 1-like n=1 Tax=Rhynchophorus ferrugineus TaxID=354439 RepID=UPI003FCC69F2